MHPVLVDAFKAWLATRGLELRRIGTLGEDDLPSWIVTPTEERMKAAIDDQSDCPACGAPKGYPPAGPCIDHGTPKARLALDEARHE